MITAFAEWLLLSIAPPAGKDRTFGGTGFTIMMATL